MSYAADRSMKHRNIVSFDVFIMFLNTNTAISHPLFLQNPYWVWSIVLSYDSVMRFRMNIGGRWDKLLKHLYHGNFTNSLEQGFVHLVEGVDVGIVGCGYLVHKALLAQKTLEKLKVSA